MLFGNPHLGGQYGRIMHFWYEDRPFGWKMGLSKDGKQGWQYVYRIHGT